jgi:hypothetical protein
VNRKKQVFALVLSLLLYLVAAAIPVLGQVEMATLLGTVRDASGAVIPGARITAKNLATGLTRQAVGSSEGDYSIPNLPLGQYIISATAQGFKTWVHTGLVLEVGQKAQVDVVLQVGAVTDQITVTASEALLDTATSSVGQVVNVRAVQEMPLNGRNFWQLVQLTPGASYIPGGQNFREGGASIRSAAVNVNINGTARIWNGWSLDGVDVTEYEQGGTVLSPNVDALQEFKVEGANMSAEYGHTPNVVNATIKSGTNQLHGSLFEFLRNDHLDARNFFFRPTPGANLQKDRLRRNQFGMTIGGPIKKNNWFFFGDYEATRLRQGIVFNSVVPSLAMRRGDFSELATPLRNPFPGPPFSNNQISDSQISKQAKFFLPFMPDPNLVLGGASRAVLTNTLSLDVDKADIKVDKQLTQKDHLMTRWSIVDNREQDPNPFPKLGAFPLRSRAQSVAIDWVRIFSPRWVNDARFGYYRSIFLFGQALAGTDFTRLAGITGFEETNTSPSFPLITLEGFQDFRGSGFDNRPKSNRIRTWQYMENLTHATGKHELKLGAQWYHQTHGFIIGGGAEGKFFFRSNAFTGNSVADFLLGTPDSVFRVFFRNLFGNSDSFKHFYVQDNYRLSPSLTLNLGLRWEINPFYFGIRTATTGFDPTTGKVVLPSELDLTDQPQAARLFGLFQDRFLRAGDLGLPNSIRPSDRRNFAPRLGFAWRPGRSNQFVIRGGYGIFWVFADTNMTLQWFKAPPWAEDQTVFNSRTAPRTWGSFFQGVPLGAPNPNPGQPCPFGFVAISCDTPDIQSGPLSLRNTYVQQWNLSTQRALTSNIAFDLAYVGNRTTRLQQFIDRNDPPPGPGSSIQLRRPFPQWGGMSVPEWVGKANYHSLQTKLDMRNWRGLQLLASYTFSKCMDTGSTEGGTTALLLPVNRSVCDFDRTHNFVLSYSYELPFGSGRRFLSNLPGWANQILGGWAVSGITTLQSGLPFTPTIIGDRANTGRGGQRPDIVSQPFVPREANCWFFISANPVCRSLFPNATDAFVVPPDARTGGPGNRRYGTAGRNILRSDSLKQLDFTLAKRFRVTESKQLAFRSEFFNLFNHPSFSAPAGAINSSNGGQVSSTLNAARQIQFGLKFLF